MKISSQKDMSAEDIAIFREKFANALRSYTDPDGKQHYDEDYVRALAIDVPDWAIQQYAACNTPESIAELLTM